MKPNYIPQRENWDCNIACIAMVCHTDYETVLSNIPEEVIKVGLTPLQELQLLDELYGEASLHALTRLPDNTYRFMGGKTYLVSLPSPDSPWNSTHRCVLWVEEDGSKVILLDPQTGEFEIDLFNLSWNFFDVIECVYNSNWS